MHLLSATTVADDRSIPALGWRHLSAAVALVSAAAFGVLTTMLVLYFHRGPTDMDSETMRFLDVTGHGAMFRFGDIMSTVSSPAVVAVLGVTVAAVLVWRKRLLDAVLVLAAPALAGVGESVIKMLVERPRPVTAPIAGESGFGFPSGHVAGSTALVLILLLLVGWSSRRWLLWSALGAVLIAAVSLGRVAVGAHYLTDVIGGWLLAAVVTFALVAASAWIAAVLVRLPVLKRWA
ncbi:MAG: hypothetical protein JWL70_903 [Acidimicrobiia bacterium]|nr:hypothetical protein [Acidimicrobiia bacterium]